MNPSKSLEDFFGEATAKINITGPGKQSELVPAKRTKKVLEELREEPNILEKKPSQKSLIGKASKKVKTPSIKDGIVPIRHSSAPKKKKRPNRALPFQLLGDLDEIIKLKQTIDEQRVEISSLKKEIKTLRIVNQRQSKAIEVSDKEHADVPKLLKTLHEDLRITKAEKTKYHDRANQMERHVASVNEQNRKLTDRIHHLQESLKNATSGDGASLREELQHLKKELIERSFQLEDAHKLLRQAETDKQREISFAKQKVVKLSKDLDQSRIQIIRLEQELKAKDRKITNLSVYTSYKSSQRKEDGRTSAASSKAYSVAKTDASKVLSPIPQEGESNDAQSLAPTIPVSLLHSSEIDSQSKTSARNAISKPKPNDAVRSRSSSMGALIKDDVKNGLKDNKPILTEVTNVTPANKPVDTIRSDIDASNSWKPVLIPKDDPQPSTQKPNIHKPNLFASSNAASSTPAPVSSYSSPAYVPSSSSDTSKPVRRANVPRATEAVVPTNYSYNLPGEEDELDLPIETLLREKTEQHLDSLATKSKTTAAVSSSKYDYDFDIPEELSS